MSRLSYTAVFLGAALAVLVALVEANQNEPPVSLPPSADEQFKLTEFCIYGSESLRQRLQSNNNVYTPLDLELLADIRQRCGKYVTVGLGPPHQK